MPTWLLFVVMSIVCWGAYIPTLHEAQAAIGGKSKGVWSFLFVGVAYFLVAVLVPAAWLWMTKREESGLPPAKGITLAIVGGILGAVGALGVIFAIVNGGKPTDVPPLVFGCAPVIATLLGMALHRPTSSPSPLFFLGILMAASGAALVLRFRPT